VSRGRGSIATAVCVCWGCVLGSWLVCRAAAHAAFATAAIQRQQQPTAAAVRLLRSYCQQPWAVCAQRNILTKLHAFTFCAAGVQRVSSVAVR
jgi:hypothetical protein